MATSPTPACKPNEPTESELTKKLNELQKSYDEAKANNAQVEAKIKQLEAVRTYVRKAKDHTLAVEKGIRNMKPDDAWKGRCRQELDNECSGPMGNAAEGLRLRVEELDRQIGQAIGGLRTQVNYFVKLVSSISDGIEGVKKEIGKLISGAA